MPAPPHSSAMVALPAVLADACAAALLAYGAPPAVLAERCRRRTPWIRKAACRACTCATAECAPAEHSPSSAESATN
eukprot:6184703-Prymnesium_polylepis.1